MKKDELPTLEEIERLMAHLPRLHAEGFVPVESWSGGKKQNDDIYSMLYPNYDPLVEEFFGTVSSDG